jgi:hypothetical protein
MRLTIIPSDGTVIKDGLAIMKLDLSFMPSNIHAVQWYDSFGEVEIKNELGKIIQNVPITSIEEYQQAIDAWEAGKVAIEQEQAEEAARIQELLARQTQTSNT